MEGAPVTRRTDVPARGERCAQWNALPIKMAASRVGNFPALFIVSCSIFVSVHVLVMFLMNEIYCFLIMFLINVYSIDKKHM